MYSIFDGRTDTIKLLCSRMPEELRIAEIEEGESNYVIHFNLKRIDTSAVIPKELPKDEDISTIDTIIIGVMVDLLSVIGHADAEKWRSMVGKEIPAEVLRRSLQIEEAKRHYLDFTYEELHARGLSDREINDLLDITHFHNIILKYPEEVLHDDIRWNCYEMLAAAFRAFEQGRIPAKSVHEEADVT